MKYKSQYQQEVNDWHFVFNEMCKGDRRARTAFTRCQEIEKEILLQKRELTLCTPKFKSAPMERIKQLQQEKKSLLFDYGLTAKKAKTYIKKLRSKQSEKCCNHAI